MKKFKWQKVLIPFFAILIIAGITFRKPEGFQSDEKFAAVGLKFTGSLSTIYNVLTDNGTYNSDTVRNILTNPVSILARFLEKYPALKYSIIQVSTGKVIYDPIAQYEKNNTMDPFPKTTNSDTYIIYSNVFNIPISDEDVKSVYPKNDNILSNCTVQSTRNSTENFISEWKDIFSSIPIVNGIKKYVRRYSSTANSIVDGTFDSKMLKRHYYAGDNYSSGYNSFLSDLDVSELNIHETRLLAALAANGFTGTKPTDPKQQDLYDQTILKYIKTTNTYLNALKDSRVELTIQSTKTVADAFTFFFGLMPDLKWETTVYEPCMASGFQNMEGFKATNVNDLNLYDYKGTKLLTAPEAEEMSGTTVAVIALGVVAVIGGGVYLVMKSSNSE